MRLRLRSLFSRIRDWGSRKAYRKAPTETFDILTKHDAPSFLSSSGPFASEALITATERLRLYSAFLFSRGGCPRNC